MSVNSIIKALEGVEQQMTNFGNDWSARNGSTGWWSDATSSSNRVFFVRYWCHNNCHNSCRHSQRSRR